MDESLTRGARPSIFSAAIGASTVAAITVLAFAGAPAQAAFPGVNGTIACGGLRGNDTDLEIFQVNPDGTGRGC